MAFGRRQRFDDVDMDVGESALRLGKRANPGFSAMVDFGSLAGETRMGPSLCILCDAVPYELLLEEGSSGMFRRMGKAVDKVEDSTAEKKRGPRARVAGTRVAEDFSPMVVNGDVLPLKGGEGCPTGVSQGLAFAGGGDGCSQGRDRSMMWSFMRGCLRQDSFYWGHAVECSCT